MNDTMKNELHELLQHFNELGESIRNDFQTLDCKSASTISNDLLPSLTFKVKKLQEIVVSIHKICKSVKKEDLKCLPCYKA